jgi:guanylate kinase
MIKFKDEKNEIKINGKIFVISGVSGSGQDSVIEELLARGLKMTRIVTTVTRRKRPGEKQGSPYYFTTENRFKKLIEENKLVEWDEHYGVYYGCTYRELARVNKIGGIILWKTETRGALAIKKKFPLAATIYIKPPSFEVALERLKKRKEDNKTIQARTKEMKNYLRVENDKKFDHIVVNKEGKLGETAMNVLKIIEKEKIKNK